MWQVLAARALVLLCILPVHECAHAWAAHKLGDNTAKWMGRMTLNPIRHLDLAGSILLLVAGFGWANPVPINARNFKNRKYGMALSALAGPVSNLVLSFVVLFVARLLFFIPIASQLVYNVLNALFSLLFLIAQISISLAVFNLLPVPPLDGSRILLLFLPEKYYFKIMQYEQYIAIGVMALVLTGALDFPIGWLSNTLCDFMMWILMF